MRPELYTKYDAQTIKATNIPYLIEIVSSIEANEAYIRTLIGKRNAPERSHQRDTEMLDISGKLL